jgi:glutamate-ammonia-ligase adenylyltransferase
VTRALLASAQDVTWLDNDEDLAPRDPERLAAEVEAIVSRADDEEQCITAVRGVRRREVVRTAAADVLGLIDSVAAATSVTVAADVAIQGALRVAQAVTAAEAGLKKSPVRMAVIAMGRYGGREMGYTSDADVQFVFEPLGKNAGAQEHAVAVAAKLRDLLQRPNPQPALAVDADLRPEGKNGPLARSLESFAEYYRRWSDPWEAQALLRARPVAGDPELCDRFTALIDEVRFPESVTPAALKQMRTLKARMESERLPRGVEPKRHVKLGPGGLSDVEWPVQLLQLEHGKRIASLRTTQTLEALRAAANEGLLSESDARDLEEAWTLATEVRGALALRGGTGDVDVLPRDLRELRVLAEIMGTGESGQQLDQRYARASRRARAVTERVFFGWAEGSPS